MLARNSIVATIGGEVVARQLLAHVQAHARGEGTPELSADASITARPFFERRGFTVEAEHHPVKAGVELTNYKMRECERSCP